MSLNHLLWYNKISTGKLIIKEHRKKLCIARKKRITTEETKLKMSIANSGENNPAFGRTGILHPLFGKFGKEHPCFGLCGEQSWMFGRRGELHPNYGKKRTVLSKLKQSTSISGENNHFFGKLHTDETKKLQSEVKVFYYDFITPDKTIIKKITTKQFASIFELSYSMCKSAFAKNMPYKGYTRAYKYPKQNKI